MPDFVYGNFEWDINKDKLNKQKHGIGFEDAIGIFFQKTFEIISIYETEFYSEQRVVAISKLNGRFITVIYTWRGVKRRIISARHSRKKEVEAYENDR